MSGCDLTLTFDRAGRTYHFGETVGGTVQVQVNSKCHCRWLGLEWQWRTHGRGDRDEGPKISLKLFEGNWEAGETYCYPFRFATPRGPATYHGTYLNVDWYLKTAADMERESGPSVEKEFLLTPPGLDSTVSIRPWRVTSDLDFSGLKPLRRIEDEIKPGVARLVFALLLFLFGLFSLWFAPILFRMQDSQLPGEFYLAALIFGPLMIVLALVLILADLTDYRSSSPGTLVGLLLAIGLELAATAVLASWFGPLAPRLGGVAVAVAALYGVYRQIGYHRMQGLAIRIEPGIVKRGNSVEYLVSVPASLEKVSTEAVVTLSCQEGVNEPADTGMRSRMYNVFTTQTLLVRGSGEIGSSLTLAGCLAVPQDAPVTFSSTHNQVFWETSVRVRAKGLPAWSHTYPIAVHP